VSQHWVSLQIKTLGIPNWINRVDRHWMLLFRLAVGIEFSTFWGNGAWNINWNNQKLNMSSWVKCLLMLNLMTYGACCRRCDYGVSEYGCLWKESDFMRRVISPQSKISEPKQECILQADKKQQHPSYIPVSRPTCLYLHPFLQTTNLHEKAST
jgi:hypothetical protein